MPEVQGKIGDGKALSLEELPDAAGELLRKCGHHKVWLFSGEMGAGKTTLIKTICGQLGVTGGMSSPTFSIVNEYEYPSGKAYHFDFYRLKNEQEAFDIGTEEYLDSGNFCFIEWPEKIPALIPKQHVEIQLTTPDPLHRTIRYASHD